MRKHAKYRDAFFSEILQHLWNGIQGSHLFFGRKQELEHAKSYITSDDLVPLIFYGEHGCGKTSILGKIATETCKWISESKSNESDAKIHKKNFELVKPVLILRFLGTSPDSSSIAPLLVSVCEQVFSLIYYIFKNKIKIDINYNPTERQQCPTEISKLFQHFKKMTTFATKSKPLVNFKSEKK